MASGCTLGPGYWKNHADNWPVTSLLLGDETYSKPQLLELLRLPSLGDASQILARQLIAAKLNIASGASADAIAATILAADGWLTGYAGKLPYFVPPWSTQGATAIALAIELAEYNYGILAGGPPSCDLQDLVPEILAIAQDFRSVIAWGAGPVRIKSVGPDGLAGTADDRLLSFVRMASRAEDLTVELVEPLMTGEIIFAEGDGGERGSTMLVSEPVRVPVLGTEGPLQSLSLLLVLGWLVVTKRPRRQRGRL